MMKILFSFLVGAIVGAAGLWYLTTAAGRSRLQTTSVQLENAAHSARDALDEKLAALHLRPQEIKDELARTGQVVRRKAQETSHALADATADTRINTLIRGKLIASPDLSVRTISVSAADGVVTLTGTVSSAEDIAKAILLAVETPGVHQVISKIEVRQAAKRG